MVFDLVRGLGAKRGELETNVLLRYAIAEPQLQWAPELEWVFADGMAVELELPAVDRELEAVKLAGQFSLPRRHSGFRDGFQAIVEIPLAEHPTQLTGLYLAGVRFDRVSLLAMVGPRIDVARSHELPLASVVNFSAFVDVDPRTVVGVELDAIMGSSAALTAMPQLHFQIRPRVRVQGGAGLTWSAQHGASVLFAMRLILE